MSKKLVRTIKCHRHTKITWLSIDPLELKWAERRPLNNNGKLLDNASNNALLVKSNGDFIDHH